LLTRQNPVWPASWDWESVEAFLHSLESVSAVLKLLVFGIYISLCCTFLPMPTGPVVALVALQQSAVGPDLATTTLLVAAVGGAASTVANLNDYYLFTLLLRHRRLAEVRHTRLYDRAIRWFRRGPFLLLVVFNLLPIPIDVIRMLAVTYRYPRVPFAAANFIGRFLRYAIIAAGTYCLGREYGWVVVAALFALAILLGLYRVLPALARRLRGVKKG
jgi:membrane protein YqaA with SNARE-associated domain